MLSWFRDNQRHMLVIFTVLLMAGFGVMGVVSSNYSSNRPQQTPEAKPVKEWKYGTVTDEELYRVHSQRVALNALQDELVVEARKSQPTYTPDSSLLMGSLLPPNAPKDQVFVQSFQILLLAKKAEDMGMFVSDAAADNYMLQFAGQWVNQNQLRAIANELGIRERLSYTDFREILKREMLASYLVYLGVSGGRPVMPSPTQAFQSYKQMNQRIECQILGFPVEDYLGKVSGQPTDAEIKALYEEGKYQFPMLDYSEPGFKVPERVQLQYFEVDMAQFTEKYKAEITEEQIKEEYDRLVEAKAPLVYDAQLSTESPLDILPDFSSGTDGDGSEESANEGDEDGLPELPMTGGEATGGDTTSSGQPPADQPPVPKKQGDGTAETTQTGTGEQNGTEKKDDQSASLASARPVYVTTQQEETEAESTETTQENDAELGLDAPTQDSSGETANAGDSETQADAVTETTPAQDGGKIRPLEEVRDQIRTRLAEPKAMDDLENIFKKLKREIGFYRTDLRLYEASPDTEPEPKALNFEQLAKDNGLTYRELAAMDEEALSQTEIGMVGAMFGTSYASALFGNFSELKLMEPESLMGDKLVWVSKKLPAEVPELDAARDTIVDYWKRNQAIDLALEDAKAMAGKVSQSEQFMKEQNEAAVQTGAFTWFTMNGFQMGAQYSRVTGVEKPGAEFMEAAFGLENMKAAAALNADRSVAYVIQKTADAGESEETLRKTFLSSTEGLGSYPTQVPMVLATENARVTQQFIKNLREEYDCRDLE